MAPTEAHRIAPLKPGAGLVFDAADWRSPEEPEEGGRVYSVDAGRRGELTLGFANGAIRFDRIRSGDLVWRSDDPGLAQLTRPYTEASAPVARRAVDVHVIANVGRPLRTIWSCGGHSVELESAVLEESRGATADLHSQLDRLGGTVYCLGQVTLDLEGNPFIPASLLNQIRRDAVARLQELEASPRTVDVHQAVIPRVRRPQETGPAQLHLLVRTPEQLDAALTLQPASITLDYLDLYGLRPSVERVRQSGMTARVASPRIFKPGERRIMDFLVSLGCPILVRSSGLLHAMRGRAEIVGDFSLNTANSLAAQVYLEMGVSRLTPGHDLNAAQVAELASAAPLEVIAYQHLPVFHTEHCVFCRFLSTGTSYRDCGRPCEKHVVQLRDSAGRNHPVMADVGCRNTVFGAEAQEAGAYVNSWLAAGIRHYRLEFAHESGAQVVEVSGLFADTLGEKITGAELSRKLKRSAPEGTTQGSLFVAGNYQVLPILQ
jgi:putative protease